MVIQCPANKPGFFMSESYTSAFVNKLIVDFQKGEKHSSYEKLNEFVNPSTQKTVNITDIGSK